MHMPFGGKDGADIRFWLPAFAQQMTILLYCFVFFIFSIDELMGVNQQHTYYESSNARKKQ